MNRTLVLGIALSLFSPRDLAAQSFQFMKLPAGGTPSSLLPLQAGISGFAIGDDFDGNSYVDVLVTSIPSGATLFHGSATGWTTTTIPWAYLQRPRPVDLDGDGDRDLAFVPHDLTIATTVRLFGNTPVGLSPVPLPAGMDTASTSGSRARSRPPSAGRAFTNAVHEVVLRRMA
jgi:hypothetical protein